MKNNPTPSYQNLNPQGSGSADQPTPSAQNNPSPIQVTQYIATLELERGGIVRMKLFNDVAPKAVANFIQKSNAGFYDNLIFHRVEPGFVVQGGDPKGNGQGGSNTLPAEYSNNLFKTGSLGMASTAGKSPVVNDSQFFITTSDNKLSATDYVLFGQVTEGMDVVNQIQVGDKIRRIRVQ